jgi:hypothetical protein
VKESIIDGTTGWLADSSGGPGALASAIELACEACSNPETQAVIGAAACNWAAAFTWSRALVRLAAAAQLASMRTAPDQCIPVVISARNAGVTAIEPSGEVTHCAHGFSILIWPADIDEATRMAEHLGGSWRHATDLEIYVGPSCPQCETSP